MSKDIQLLRTFREILGLKNKITAKKSSYTGKKDCHYVQFSDVILYKWLLAIGLMPNKTKRLKEVKIPDKYFFDFLRGYFDGDGSCYGYWDKRWRSSFMFYTSFVSGNLNYIKWLRTHIKNLAQIKGHISKSKKTWMLKYAKNESKILFSKMYHKKNLPRLERKYKKLKSILEIDRREAKRKNLLR